MKDSIPPVRFALGLAAAVLAGLALRLWNLRDQILGGDELHLARAILRWPVLKILTTYGLADTSIPLTAFYRLLFDAGVVFSEIDFRLPALLCGGLALVVLPWAVAGRLDRPSAAIFGWLVAISPGLVLYSRIARSYMPMVLCACCAALAFEAWWRTRAWKHAALYLGLGSLAVWIHLGAAPFVAAPFLFAAGDLAVRSEDRWKRLRDLVGVGVGLTLLFAAFLLPARRSLLRLVTAKHVEQDLPLSTLGTALRLDAGAASQGVIVLFWIAALCGLALLLRRQPRFGAFTLTTVVGHIAGIVLLSPKGMGHPLVTFRYLLPTLPFLLLWVAYALGCLWSRWPAGHRGRIVERSAVVLFVLLLLGTGPFLSPGFQGGSFVHHDHFLLLTVPRIRLPEEALPAPYHHLPPGPVLEYPWPARWELARSFYAYQSLHGRRVLVSAPYDVPRHPQIRFRNEIPPEPEALLDSPARTLIVHLGLPREEQAVQGPGHPPRIGTPHHRRIYQRVGQEMAAALQRTWGPPDWTGTRIRAWDLERVRRAGGPALTAFSTDLSRE